MKTDILFVNPWYPVYDGPITDNRLPPLDLINCASVMQEAGHSVQIIDAHILELTDERLADYPISRTPQNIVVCTSPINTWQCPPITITPFFKTVSVLKIRFPNAKVIGTGPGSIFYSEQMLDVCDIVIYGQPESFFLSLCEDFRADLFETTAGVMLRTDSGSMKQTPADKRIDMEKLPIPNYQLVPFHLYHFGVMNSWVIQLETSRGCPQFCKFCFQEMTLYKYNRKTPEQVVRELYYVAHSLEGRSVFFVDLDMGVVENYFVELLDHIIEADLPVQWSCNIRSSSFRPELLEKMKQAKCKTVLIGIESADDSFQGEMVKNKSILELKKRIVLAKTYGLQVAGYFMIGIPGETEIEVMKTIRLSNELLLDFASFQVMVSYPTTGYNPDTSEICQNGSALSLQKLRTLQALAYRRFYLRPTYVFKRIPLLFHPKALFANLKVFVDAARSH
jgi:anaerobic magnesium-protoporphyrin IX monomethyl ester cyclase